MFERFLSPANLRKHPEYAVYGGVLVTLVAFATSSFLFINTPRFIGVATVLFAVVVGVPAMNALFVEEERKIEKKEGGLMRHRGIMRFLFYFFMGVFLTLFVIALITPSKVLSSTDLYGVQPAAAPSKIHGPPPPPTPESSLILGIFYNNIVVLLIAFVLSLFYGSGALLLIVLNASIFASSLASAIRVQAPTGGFTINFLFIGCNLTVMLMHLIPEMAAYLFAATAGGLLGTGISRKVWRNKALWPLVKDICILTVCSLLLLASSAIIEVLVSKQLFALAVCSTKPLFIVSAAAAAIVILIGGETIRRNINR